MSYSKNCVILEKYMSRSMSHLSCHFKKNQYLVKDGWIIYKVRLSPIIACQCSQENLLCDHILHVLDTMYHIKFDILKFFHKLNPQIAGIIAQKKSDINGEIIEIINKHIINDNCGICLEPMDVESLFNQSLYECPKCLKHTHIKCIHRWKTRNLGNDCIYCRG